MSLETIYEEVDREWNRRAMEERTARDALLSFFEENSGPVMALDVETKIEASTRIGKAAVHSALFTLIASRQVDERFDGLYPVTGNGQSE